MIDDAIFTMLDISNGMDPLDAMESFGKKAVTSYVSGKIGQGFNGIANAKGVMSGGLLQTLDLTDSVIGSTLLKGTEMMASNIASSAINSISVRGLMNGGDFFNEKAFIEGSFGSSALAGVAAGMTGTFVTEGLGNINLFDGNKIALNGETFNTVGIQSFNRFVGSMTSSGVTYGLTGNAKFNVARIGGTGIMEMNIGKDGFGMNFGMGGTDISMGTISKAIQGYKESSKVIDWKFGTKEQKADLNAINMLGWTGIAGNKANVNLSKDIWGGKLKTRYEDMDENAHGYYDRDQKPDEIVLSTALLGSGKDAAAKLATVMGHEGMHANGNRIEGEAHEQGLATYDQITKIFGLTADSAFAQSMVDAINDPESWKENVGSRDNWRFNLDGSVEDDGKKYFSRQIVDAHGNVVDQKIDGSDFTGSRAAALIKAIGIDNVRGMLNGSANSISDLPAEVIASATGCTLETAEQMKMNPSMAPDLMREGSETQARLIGELLLYENGSSWDDGSKKWSDGSLRIPGLGYNDSLGVNRNNDGTYEFFTAGMILNRDDDAFDTWKDDKGSKDYNVRDNTSVTMWKRDLFSGKTTETPFNGAWTSIDNAFGNEVTVDGHKYMGNTIISEYFKMHLIPWVNTKGNDYGVERVGVATEAITLAGDYIRKQGNTKPGEARWLFPHPFGAPATSQGCGGPMSDQTIILPQNYGKKPVWNNPSIKNTGAWYMDQFLKQVDSSGIYDGYDFNMRIKGKVKP